MAASRFHHLTGATFAALAGAAALLAGCGEHHVMPAEQPSAPVSRPTDLSGAPYVGPAGPAMAVDVPPPPMPYGPPMPPPSAPGDRDVIYDLGPVVQPHDTMAPIPNPPEPSCRRGFGPCGRPARHPPVWRCREERGCPRPAPGRPLHPRGWHCREAGTCPGPHHKPHQPKPSGPVAPVAPAKPSGPVAPSTPSKPSGPSTSGGSKAASSQTKSNSAAGQTNAPAATGDHAQHIQALQTALTADVGRLAQLNAPELKPDQPADVTLTLPADFYSTVRDEAAKQGLGDAAASAKATALLSGDGYAIAPDQTLSQTLTVGQPTEFHWTVTAQTGANPSSVRGPLHADVGVDLLGGGDEPLKLGTVAAASKSGLHISPRAWGALLLLVLAGVVFAVISGRGREARRRRTRRHNLQRDERPFEMGEDRPPPVDREF